MEQAGRGHLGKQRPLEGCPSAQQRLQQVKEKQVKKGTLPGLFLVQQLQQVSARLIQRLVEVESVPAQ